MTFVTVNCLNICQIIYFPFYGGDIERFAVPAFRIKISVSKMEKVFDEMRWEIMHEEIKSIKLVAGAVQAWQQC